VRGCRTGSWRFGSVLRGESTTIYASSQFNRAGRRAARYDSGLPAHRYNQPARKRPAPPRTAHEQIACSRSRCGNSSTHSLPPVNPHPLSFSRQPPLLHNHARYDAFGNLVHSTGTTPNNYLFAGEQFDPDLNLYYNRARYLNVSTGRFWTMDSYEGFGKEPLTLQKYLYADGNPVNSSDPTGRFIVSLLSNAIYGRRVHDTVTEEFLDEYEPPDGRADESIDSILDTDAGPNGALRPDLVSIPTGEVYEIASQLGASVRFWKILDELDTFNKYDPLKREWTTGSSFVPNHLIKLDPLTFAVVDPPVAGVIVYTVVNAGEIYFLAAIAVNSITPQLETETGTALTFAVEGGF
jgi:RHS repeat-associated protein